MGTNLLSLPDDLLLGRRTFGIFDDFDYLEEQESGSTGRWNTIETGSGAAISTAAGVGGAATVQTGSADNDDAYLYSNEIFLLADGKPLVAEMRMKYTEANTDDANVVFGVMDAITADTTLLVDGGGPDNTYDGACFFKIDGGTNWNVEASDNTTQITHELNATNSLDGLAKACSDTASYQVFQIKIQPTSSTRMDVSFLIDGTLVKKIDSTYTSPTEMALVVGAMAGAGNAEALTVDYLSAYQLR